MNFTMITPYHNHDDGYISIIIKNFFDLPETIVVDNKTLFKKSEFHISLLALKHIVPLINQSGGQASEDNLVQDFLDIQKQLILSDFQLTNDLRYVKRAERETVIAMVEVPGIEDLFDKLRKKYDVNIPSQPTHITLYTLQADMGIGILSRDELLKCSEHITVPELKTIFESRTS